MNDMNWERQKAALRPDPEPYAGEVFKPFPRRNCSCAHHGRYLWQGPCEGCQRDYWRQYLIDEGYAREVYETEERPISKDGKSRGNFIILYFLEAL